MAILSLLAKLGLDKTGFDAGLAAADKSVTKFGSQMKARLAGAFSAAAVVSFTKSLIDMGGQIKDTSDRLGISTDQVQDFALAAKLGGTDIETFAGAIEKLRKATAEGKGLELFGVTKEMMRSGDLDAIFSQLGKSLEDGLNGERTKQFLDVFGRGGGRLIPAIFELQRARQERKMTPGEIEAADRAGDAWAIARERIKRLGIGLATGLAGVHPEAPLQGVTYKGKTIPRISDRDIAQAEADEHQRTQDKILQLEQEAAQRKREQHMREQDEVLRQQRISGMSPFERELFKHTQQLESINQTLNERGIVIRDMVE